jgi:hypothetical protein
VFAAREAIGGHVVTVVGAVLGQPLPPGQPTMLDAAFTAATALLQSASHAITRYQVAAPGSAVAWLKAPWTHSVAVRPAKVVSFVGWPGLPIRARVVPVRPIGLPVRSGQTVGIAVATVGQQHLEVNLGASAALTAPSFGWRLTHP